jgi:glycosyltransferase involved in cell wall biosynthesis
MKVAILWTGLSGYLNACLKELAGREGVEIFVSHRPPSSSAPFDNGQFAWIPNQLLWRRNRDLVTLRQRLHSFAPDILVFAGWTVPHYRRAAREYKKKAWRVMTMDNCWRGTLKQRLGVLSSPAFLQPMADAVWLPGERQAAFARRLGFSQERILRGLYTCDQRAMEAGYQARVAEGRPMPRKFVFVGRLIAEKGVDTLVNAYRAYRATTSDPWPLVCCGAGPLQSSLEGKAGIEMQGFVQPERLPDTLASAGCLILPSELEPWGVAVHEAASAGLLILATEAVGAVVHLVQPNYNGYIFNRSDVDGLAGLMSRLSAMSDARLDAMSRASHSLSRQFSPDRWADTLLHSFQALRQKQGTQAEAARSG